MLFTFPSRYWSTIGLSGVFSLAGWSRRIHAGFLVPRATQDAATLRIVSRTRLSLSTVELSRSFRSRCFLRPRGPTTPAMPRQRRFGLFPVRSPLLGESRLFSFPAGTKMFQFPALASCIAGCHPFRMTGCPIRRSADRRSFAPPRGFSQLITSFVASESQGIRHAPFPTSCARGPKAACRPGLATRDFVFRFDVPTCHRTRRFSAPVENNGFEPLTPCLQSRCSSQLS